MQFCRAAASLDPQALRIELVHLVKLRRQIDCVAMRNRDVASAPNRDHIGQTGFMHVDERVGAKMFRRG